MSIHTSLQMLDFQGSGILLCLFKTIFRTVLHRNSQMVTYCYKYRIEFYGCEGQVKVPKKAFY